MSVITFKYRLKDARTAAKLAEYAVRCNQVWNFCVETQRRAEARYRAGLASRWPSAFDLAKLTTGSSVLLGLHSDTVNAICRQFVRARDQRSRCPRFRVSFGARRSLGWLPFIPRAVQISGDEITYLKRRFRFWKSREIEGDFRCGVFVEDARGRWYVAFQCEVADDLPLGNGAVGIDLGLKNFAALSSGEKIPAFRLFHRHHAALRIAQRANKKRRVRAIHAKIANARRHHLHERSAKIARENQLIVIGDVSSSKLAKTRMAKSVQDAGWATFRTQLQYKARRRGAIFVIADERWTSRTCSACGAVPASAPKGMDALGMRFWVCEDCGASHDRDVNAARNILRIGLECQPPAGGISVH